MNISNVRSEFTVFVVESDKNLRNTLQNSLEKVGYQVEGFENAVGVVEEVRRMPPHVFLCHWEMKGSHGRGLISEIVALSPDIQIIGLTRQGEGEAEIMRLGAYDFINEPMENSDVIVPIVDRAVEKLYLTYQNEELADHLRKKKRPIYAIAAQRNSSVREIDYTFWPGFVARMSEAKDQNEVIQTFLQELSDHLESAPIFYLRHVPSYFSLVMSNAVQLPKERLRGLGLEFRNRAPGEYAQILDSPQETASLKDLISQVFNVKEFSVFPVKNQDQVWGLIVILRKLSKKETSQFQSFYHILRVFCRNVSLEKQIHDVAIRDPLTGLYNSKYLHLKIEEEVSRSRRTKLPVSLIYMAVDNFKEFEENCGTVAAEVLLKMVSQLLKKTSRCTDVVTRISREEFVILLPQTGKTGAAIRAEKLRLAVNSTQFPMSERTYLRKITVSCGVSEYPSVCHDGIGLLETGDSALYQVKKASMNRVCLSTPPNGFEPEFVALELNTKSEEK